MVRVVVHIEATNTTPPATTGGGVVRRSYFAAIHVAVQPEAVNIRATSGGHRLGTTVDDRKGYLRVAVTLRSRLYYRQAADVQVSYDLPGGKPRSDSEIRVGRAFASFYAWANGDLASVRIVVPDTFDPTVTGADLDRAPVGWPHRLQRRADQRDRALVRGRRRRPVELARRPLADHPHRRVRGGPGLARGPRVARPGGRPPRARTAASSIGSSACPGR